MSRRLLVGVLALVGFGGTPLIRLLLAGDASVPTAIAQSGHFEVRIAETGVLQALKSLTYASSIQSNQAKIVALAAEGKIVGKGELLILFDSTPFEQQMRESEALLAQAQADFVKAQQDLKLQALQNEEDVAASRQKEQMATLELRDVEEGDGKLREEKARSELAEAARKVRTAETARDDLQPLLKEGFITRQEMERAQQDVEKARDDLALAKRRHDAFFKFGRPLEMAQAQSQALASRGSAKALVVAAASRIEQRQAALEGARSRVQEAEARLASARAQLRLCEVRADVPGIVVYRPVLFASDQRKPQIGDQVWANQPLLTLPDISRMTVETRVREVDIHRISENQRVSVHVAAYPDLRLTGRVSLIGTLAQEDGSRRNTKYFGVTVEVNESDARLRPGMTASVEIHVEEREGVLFVPIQAVFEREGRQIVYVRKLGRFSEREVVIGSVNRDLAEIEGGLRPGDRVALSDPLLGLAEGDRP